MSVWDPDTQYPEQKLYGLYDGFVLERDDPDGLGRVKVTVPGILEESDWAFPVGVPGGGAGQGGLWWVPKVNASVAVFFVAGDIEAPRYMPSHWGDGEAPTDAHVDKAILETDSWIIEIDKRSGQRSLKLRSKTTDDHLELDLESGETVISGSSKVIVNAPNVYLGSDTAGHPVAWGDIVSDLLNGFAQLLKSAAPLGFAAIPVAFSADVTGFTTKYGAGGITAVTTAGMAADLAANKSGNVNTE